MKEKFSQHSETEVLRKVIIGRWEGYSRAEEYIEIVNESQKKGHPETDQLRAEFEALQRVLEENKVEVLIPEYVGKFVYDQLTPRDIAVVIGEKLVLCNMAKPSRKYEAAGIFPLIQQFSGNEPDILIPPADCLLEGGDIMLDKGTVLVGISERTNTKGFEWLKSKFGDSFDVDSVGIKSREEGEHVLHLDCAFNPVGRNSALIYKEGLKEIPEIIKSGYELIDVTREEQRELATNVFSISPDKVIARDHPQCKRISQEMRKRGIEVVEIKFDGAPSTGGSFRCCTLPLIRGGS
jgi:N-dimethylarginine dimethylaminohydrolase